ncbi:hypothetical protein GCM10008018_54320 [Paenibacillus marchantiophytorum]|uniref:Uncharacterized protein n=1 Tax=Paenibacillus marchantiophytorum TaxID=1619310 RepID=A0ABQ1F624_9BACL|nr:hypothetical protein [Paenibacillus marchantiophytorum]GGA01105.1 hypothetical protein GCM10008018_54320 [Paenibacillus marchantiophytorum]
MKSKNWYGISAEIVPVKDIGEQIGETSKEAAVCAGSLFDICLIYETRTTFYLKLK